MALADGDIIQVSWRGHSMAQSILLVRNYVVAAGGGDPGNDVLQDLDAIANAVKPAGTSDMTTAYLACLGTNYFLDAIRTQRVYPTRSALWEDGFTGTPGTNASDAVVPNDAAVVTNRTIKAGRNQVSNIHIGPIPAAAAVDGFLTPTYKALINTLADKLSTIFSPVGFAGRLEPVIFHKSNGTFDNLREYVIQPESRVMVRRTVNRGS